MKIAPRTAQIIGLRSGHSHISNIGEFPYRVAGRIREEGGAIEKENSLVGTVDIINGQDSQVPVVTEVTQGNASAGLEVVVGDGLLGDIEGNGHREEVAIGKTDVFADTWSISIHFDFSRLSRLEITCSSPSRS